MQANSQTLRANIYRAGISMLNCKGLNYKGLNCKGLNIGLNLFYLGLINRKKSYFTVTKPTELLESLNTG